MPTVTSADGTNIAFETTGSGPPLILVDGAWCYRAFGPSRPLAKELAHAFTVYTYDRRGRGESGDGPAYAVEREVEDLKALATQAGGEPNVYGISSGAALALEAVQRGLKVKKLALYEAPFIVDDTRKPLPADYLARLRRAIAENRRGDAIKIFMREGVAVPAFAVFTMRLMPAWSKLKQVAHTVTNDTEILGDTGSGKPLGAARWSAVTVPTLVAVGTSSPPWMRNAMRALAGVLPQAKHEELKGQTHMVKPKVLAKVLERFFR